MSWPWIQVAVLMTMTHIVRVVGDRLGPRWGAIVLGMPSTTAVLLVGGGCERGIAEAARAAEIGLLGLVAAIVLPLAYAGAVGRGRGVIASALFAVLGYAITAGPMRALPDIGAAGGFLVATLGVVGGCCIARKLPATQNGIRCHKTHCTFILRTTVPALFLLGIREFRSWAGPLWAGLFATFPAMSLAVLVTLHLERGPAAVCRLARSMPRGNLGMVAFLMTYRLCCYDFGPFGAAAFGYLSVLVVMVILSRPPHREFRIPAPVVRAWHLSLPAEARNHAPPGPRGAKIFAPGVESLAV